MSYTSQELFDLAKTNVPANRLYDALHFREMARQTIYGVVHDCRWKVSATLPHDAFNATATTWATEWVVGPVISQTPVIVSPMRWVTDTHPGKTCWCLHADDVLSGAEMIRTLRLSHYNAIAYSNIGNRFNVLLRTPEEVDRWRFTLALLFDGEAPSELVPKFAIDEIDRYRIEDVIQDWMVEFG